MKQAIDEADQRAHDQPEQQCDDERDLDALVEPRREHERERHDRGYRQVDLCSEDDEGQADGDDAGD